jgi:hypothetical protein
MDKKKQIEEIEKEKCKYFDEEVCSKLNCKKNCKYYGKSNCYRCIHKNICQLRTFSYCEEEVKEKGCYHYKQEIPEGAVVLTKEEYDGLKLIASNYSKAVKEVETRTAEKYAKMLKAKLSKWLDDNEDLNFKIDKGIAIIELIGAETLEGEVIAEGLIDEICKEITEGKV